ncbi:hypothetical protein [Haloterrigena salifodinae]|nr:hypothetical protein [Haloterrigena salifodinae]
MLEIEYGRLIEGRGRIGAIVQIDKIDRRVAIGGIGEIATVYREDS